MRKLSFLTTTLFLVFGLASSVFAASTPQLVSTHGDWSVYTFDDAGAKVCFMSSQPFSKEGNYSKRGEVFIFITRWSDKKDSNVVSISNGYTFKKDSTVSVKVAGEAFKMFTQGEMAWTKDTDTDNKLTQAVKKGSNIIVEGTSKYGTNTKDTYSLKGSSDAYLAMVKTCK